MTSRSKLDWYKRNPAKFIGGTVGMSFEVKAAYGLVLDLIYDGGGSCPDDGPWIANILGVGMTTRRWGIIRAELIERGKLQAKEGRLFNKAATRIIARDAVAVTPVTPEETGEKGQDKIEFIPPDKSEKKPTDLFADNGLTPLTPSSPNALPARARESQSQNQNQKETRPGETMPSQVQIIVQVELIATTLGQKRGQYWERDYRRMLEDGLLPEFILEAAKAHRGDPIKGINALKGLALVKQKASLERNPPPPPVAEAPHHSSKAWEGELTKLLRRGGWDPFTYGPPPTREGHHVPPELYAGWKKLWDLQGAHPLEEFDHSANLVPYPADWPSDLFRSFWEPDK